jgi:hypothetical protein
VSVIARLQFRAKPGQRIHERLVRPVAHGDVAVDGGEARPQRRHGEQQARRHGALTGVESDRAVGELAAVTRDTHHAFSGVVDRYTQLPQAVFHAPVVVAFAGITDGADAVGQCRDGAVAQGQRLAARQRGFEFEWAGRPGHEVECRRIAL